jgi:hypothetical protein
MQTMRYKLLLIFCLEAMLFLFARAGNQQKSAGRSRLKMSISYQKNSTPDSVIYVWDDHKRLASLIRSFVRYDYHYCGDTVFSVRKFNMSDPDLIEFWVIANGRIMADNQNYSYKYSEDGRKQTIERPNADTSRITFENGDMISRSITGTRHGYNELYTYSYYPEPDKRDGGPPSLVGYASQHLVHMEIKRLTATFCDTISYCDTITHEYSFDKSGRPKTETAKFSVGGLINFIYFYEEE